MIRTMLTRTYFNILLLAYLWYVNGESLELGSDVVNYLRNTDIKTMLALKQPYLKQQRYSTKSYQRPAQYKDVGSIRGGLNIPESMKSAEIHYRVGRKMNDCGETKIKHNLEELRKTLPLLFTKEMLERAEKRLKRRYRKYLRYRQAHINDRPVCEIEFRILHNRDIYAVIDPEIKELTQLSVNLKVSRPRNRRLKKNIQGVLSTSEPSTSSSVTDPWP